MRPITLLEPFRALFYAPFYVAEARGAFARQGAAMLACGAISHVPPFEDCVETGLVEEALAS